MAMVTQGNEHVRSNEWLAGMPLVEECPKASHQQQEGEAKHERPAAKAQHETLALLRNTGAH